MKSVDMKHHISKEELQNDLLFETLVALEHCLRQFSAPLYVVGACARDLVLKILKVDKAKRKTLDLDVAVMLKDWSTFDNLVKVLEDSHFIRLGNSQKFYYKGPDEKNDYEVDIVPFGDIADNEVVKWPPDGNPELSVRCFTDVLDNAIDVNVDGVIDLKIAPISGQFLIKLDTWNDRHIRDDRDAMDMYTLVSKYYDYILYNHPQRFADVDEEFSDWSSAYLLAQDAAMLLTADHLCFFVDLIGRELSLGDESDLVYQFMKGYGLDEDKAYETSYNVWKTIYSVFSKHLNQRNNDGCKV